MRVAMSHITSLAPLHNDIAQYYGAKLLRYGPTPLGVDWTCIPTQELRFVQLLKLCDFKAPLSINDVGCGYGALLGYLSRRHRHAQIDYLGTDLCQAMVDEARKKWQRRPHTRFEIASASIRIADYSVASGIFNVKLDQSQEDWTRFIEVTLSDLHLSSRLGFAVNFLAPLAPGAVVKPQLYRMAPEYWVEWCCKRFAAKVQMLDGYGLREYTLTVHPG